MAFVFFCPRCGVMIQAVVAPIRATAECPACREIIDVPQPPMAENANEKRPMAVWGHPDYHSDTSDRPKFNSEFGADAVQTPSADAARLSQDLMSAQPEPRNAPEDHVDNWRSVRTGLNCVGGAAGLGVAVTAMAITAGLANRGQPLSSMLSILLLVLGLVQFVLVMIGQGLCCRVPTGHPGKSWALVSLAGLLVSVTVAGVLILISSFQQWSLTGLLSEGLILLVAGTACFMASHISFVFFLRKLGVSFGDASHATRCGVYLAFFALTSCCFVLYLFTGGTKLLTIVGLLWFMTQGLFMAMTLSAPTEKRQPESVPASGFVDLEKVDISTHRGIAEPVEAADSAQSYPQVGARRLAIRSSVPSSQSISIGNDVDIDSRWWPVVLGLNLVTLAGMVRFSIFLLLIPVDDAVKSRLLVHLFAEGVPFLLLFVGQACCCRAPQNFSHQPTAVGSFVLLCIFLFLGFAFFVTGAFGSGDFRGGNLDLGTLVTVLGALVTLLMLLVLLIVSHVLYVRFLASVGRLFGPAIHNNLCNLYLTVLVIFGAVMVIAVVQVLTVGIETIGQIPIYAIAFGLLNVIGQVLFIVINVLAISRKFRIIIATTDPQ